MYHSYYEERIKKIMVQREYMQVRAGTEKQKKEEKKKKEQIGNAVVHGSREEWIHGRGLDRDPGRWEVMSLVGMVLLFLLGLFFYFLT